MSNEAQKIQINPDDFKSPKVKISLFNLTDNKKIEPKKEGQQVEFIEFLDVSGLAVSVPPHSGAKGHELKVEITLETTKNTIEVTGKATVVETEQVPGKNYRMDLLLEEYDEKKWDEIISVFAKRQEEVLSLLDQLKN